jgi:hypothetical protein
MTRPTKIFIFGDSFGDVTACGDDQRRAWPSLITKQMAEKFKRPIEIINWSMIGASQDHTWSCIMNCVEKGEITPNDYMIVLMTSPDRFWFFEDQPYRTNTAIIDFDDDISPEQANSAAMFFQYIQRPQLSNLHLNFRLGWLNFIVQSMKLRTPLLIPCFPQEIVAKSYPALNIARGNLYDVQSNEWLGNSGSNNWQGVDLRFVHLCLRNHRVLADLIFNSLWRTTKLDLNSDQFHKEFLTLDCINDREFFDNEFSLSQYQDLVAIQEKISKLDPSAVNPWAKRAGILLKKFI